MHLNGIASNLAICPFEKQIPFSPGRLYFQVKENRVTFMKQKENYVLLLTCTSCGWLVLTVAIYLRCRNVRNPPKGNEEGNRMSALWINRLIILVVSSELQVLTKFTAAHGHSAANRKRESPPLVGQCESETRRHSSPSDHLSSIILAITCSDKVITAT